MSEQPITDPVTRHFNDLQFSLVATPFKYRVEFVIYDHFGQDAEGSPIFKKDDLPASSIDDAEIYLHGDVKWDGCSNWYFDEQDRAMLHGCSRHDVARIGEILGRCWDLARDLCPKFDQ